MKLHGERRSPPNAGLGQALGIQRLSHSLELVRKTRLRAGHLSNLAGKVVYGMCSFTGVCVYYCSNTGDRFVYTVFRIGNKARNSSPKVFFPGPTQARFKKESNSLIHLQTTSALRR
jgi:hypothetical protein